MNYKLLHNEPMSLHTTFRTGGRAKDYYIIDNAEGLIQVFDICRNQGVKPLVIGNGSNLLISDMGLDVPVIEIGSGLCDISVEGNIIKAEAGAMLSKVAKTALQNGLAGMEFASGIPGTIGGAVYMNAGAYGGEIKDIAVSVDVLKDGELLTIPAEEMDFGYRHSRIMDEEMIVLGLTIQLENGEKSEIEEKMNDFNSRRRDKQPLEYPSAGSTFKRPEGYFAGKLIMDSGLAGKSIGGAMVSPKHCGFIINYDNATSTDVYELIKYVVSEVKNKFGVELETEVKLIGEFL